MTFTATTDKDWLVLNVKHDDGRQHGVSITLPLTPASLAAALRLVADQIKP